MTAAAGARRFDAVVVGAGVAGLTAACFLARAGRRVALLEAGTEVGGCCRTLSTGGLDWDLALYSLRGGGPGGPLTTLLEELGIAGRLALRHTAASYLVRLDGGEFPVTTERDAMLTAADQLEPGGADRLACLWERILGFSPVRDYRALARLSFTEAAAAAGVRGNLLAALSAPLMISLGLPPGRASAYFAFMKYRLILAGGADHPEGGADSLVRALAERFESSGGYLFAGERVEAISLEPGGAKRVLAASGPFVAEALVLAVDATAALSWIAPALPERLLGKPAGLTAALSASLLFCSAPGSALRAIGLDRAPQVIMVRETDLAEAYRGLRDGRPGSGDAVVGLTSPAAWQLPFPSGGEQPLSAFFLAHHERGRPDPGGEELLGRLRRAVPGLPEGLSARVSWGPNELAARTGNRSGSFCGWEMGPERYGPARIPAKLPIPGVHLAGHWTDPGPSVLNAMLSGRAAALAILR